MKVLFYGSNGIFSTTKMINIVLFILTVITWIFLLVLLVKEFKATGKVNTALAGILTGFATTVTGGSFYQYSYGKKLRNGSESKPAGTPQIRNNKEEIQV